MDQMSEMKIGLQRCGVSTCKSQVDIVFTVEENTHSHWCNHAECLFVFFIFLSSVTFGLQVFLRSGLVVRDQPGQQLEIEVSAMCTAEFK
jgi:hypothetical protein